jgi:hypothetical protein
MNCDFALTRVNVFLATVILVGCGLLVACAAAVSG